MNLSRKITLTVAGALAAGALGYGISAASPASHNGPATTQSAADIRKLMSAPAHPESLYVPLTNCRIVNTAVAGGRIPNGSARNFQVTGTLGFPGQGGQNGGCGVPSYATAVSARISSNGALGNGAFIAYPTGTPTGQGTLYYAKGVNVTTGATLQVGAAGKVTVKNVAGPAFTAIDVNGYYAPQIHALIASNGAIVSGTPQVVSSTRTSTGSYTIAINQDLTGCTAVSGMDGGAFFSSAVISGNSLFGGTYNVTGARQDLYWTFTVLC